MRNKAAILPGIEGEGALSRFEAILMSLVSGLFSTGVILLLLMNYHDMRESDPLTSFNSQKLNELVEKHRLAPGDESIKREIQALDQRIRQDYFNSLRKARFGGCLLVAGIVVFVISLKKSFVSRIVPGSGRQPRHIGHSRMALAAFAIFLIITAVLISFAWKN